MSETNKDQFGLQGSPEGITTERSEGVIPLYFMYSPPFLRFAQDFHLSTSVKRGYILIYNYLLKPGLPG